MWCETKVKQYTTHVRGLRKSVDANLVNENATLSRRFTTKAPQKKKSKAPEQKLCLNRVVYLFVKIRTLTQTQDEMKLESFLCGVTCAPFLRFGFESWYISRGVSQTTNKEVKHFENIKEYGSSRKMVVEDGTLPGVFCPRVLSMLCVTVFNV